MRRQRRRRSKERKVETHDDKKNFNGAFFLKDLFILRMSSRRGSEREMLSKILENFFCALVFFSCTVILFGRQRKRRRVY